MRTPRKSEWFDDDTLWRILTPLMFSKERCGDAEALLPKALKLVQVPQDMRDFVRPGAFDVALSMFTSFGYCDDKGEDVLVLKNIFASLRPGGSLLMELAGKEILARIFQPTTSTPMPDGSLLVEQHDVFDGWSRMRNEWTFIQDGKARTWRFHLTIYSGQELRDRLEQADFAEVKLFGSFDGV